MIKKQAPKKIIKSKSKKKGSTMLDKFLSIFLLIGSVLIAMFFAYIVWLMISNKSITYFLPAQKTVAYFEFDNASISKKSNQNSIVDMINLSPVLQKSFSLDIKKLQKDLMHGKFGLALIDHNDKNNPLLFFRISSKSKTLNYFKQLGLSNEKLTITGDKKDVLYSYPQSHNFNFTFVGPYLFIAEKSDTLKLVQDVYSKKEKGLNEDQDYIKTIANLPKYNWGRAYINVKSFNLTSANPINQIVDPLKYIINHFALTVRKRPNGFHFNTLLSINPQLLAFKKGYVDPTKFSYKLADYIGTENLAVYVGGSNLSDEWENTLKTVSKLNPAYGVILEGVLRAQVSKVFSDQVSLRNDIYPIFNDEYALILEKIPTFSTKSDDKSKNTIVSKDFNLGIKLILKHSDKKFAKIKADKLISGFKLIAAKLTPQLKIFKLPDGKENREVTATSKNLKETKETYKGNEIRCMDIPGSYYGFCYTVTNTLIIMGNNAASIKETIDLKSNSKTALSKSQSFRKSLSNLSIVSDEVTFVKFDNLSKIIADTKINPIVSNFFSSFSSAAWVKRYFNDGVSTEGYLLLK